LQVTAECFSEIATSAVKLNFELSPEDEDVMLLRSLVKIPLSPPVEDDNGLSGSREAGSAIMVAEVRGDGVDVTKAKPKKGSVKISLADVDPDEIVRRDLDNEDSEEEEDSDGEGEFVFLPSGTVCKKNETFRKTIPKLF